MFYNLSQPVPLLNPQNMDPNKSSTRLLHVLLQPDEPIEASILVTTKCEIAENFQILLRGLIVSRPPDPATVATPEELIPSIETPAAEERPVVTPGATAPAPNE